MFNPQEHHQMLPYFPRPPAAVDRWKPAVEIAPNCPRCDSSNTKFCYYNNYSLTQPRYFCKGCRRYWTKGGSLRNVPVGGGCRKNRRGKSSVRPSRDPSSSSSGVEANNSHNQLGYGLRPDLALDDMVGNSSAAFSGGSEGSSTTDMLSSDGSTIDLALLYAKFLNQRPAPAIDSSFAPPELPVEIDDPFELIMSSWDPNQEMAPAAEQERSPQVMLGSLSSNESQIDHGNYLGFSSDPISSYGSVGAFPVDGGMLGDGFVSNCTLVPDQSLGFHPIPMVHHQDLLVGDWSTLVHSNFEPF